MGEKFDIELEVDTKMAERALDELERRRLELETKTINTISFVNKGTEEMYSTSLENARAAWLTTRGVLRIGGESVSSYFNLLIHTAFRTVEILTPLFTAKEAASYGLDPTVWIGLTNLGMATAAAIAAEMEQHELASRLHGMTTSLRGLTYLFGQNY